MAAPSSLAHKTTTEYSTYTYDACCANCVLTLSAPDVDEQERAPVSCSFVLDISGSMQGSKLKLMQKASQFSLRQLSGKDHLGLIAFGSEVHNTLPIGCVTKTHKARADQELSLLRAHTCTNLAGGLFAGITQQLSAQLSSPVPTPETPTSTQGSGNGTTPTPATEEQPSAAPEDPSPTAPPAPQPIRSVFLFTDGRPTVGMRDSDSILKVMSSMLTGPPPAAASVAPSEEEEMCDIVTSPTTDGTDTADPAAVAAAAAATPPTVKVHTFGFGGDSDPNLLSTIADRGAGSYYFIDNADDIPAAFADALGGILSVAAQNVVLRVSPANGAHVTAVRSGFPTTREGSDHVVRLPDVYAEEVKDLVVRVELPSMHGEDVAEDCEFTAATLRVEFIDTVRARPAVIMGEVRVRRSAEAEAEGAPATASTRVRAQLTRLDAMDSMLRAMSLADRGDFNNARGVLRGIEEGLQSLAVSEAPTGASDSDAAEAVAAAAMVQQLRSDVRTMSAGYASRAAYDGGGDHCTKVLCKSHATQRSTYMSALGSAHSNASRAGGRPAYRARQNASVAAAPAPAPSSPPSARPRSASGQDPDTPSKKSRVKMFLNQMTSSFRRSSRDGEGAEGAVQQAAPVGDDDGPVAASGNPTTLSSAALGLPPPGGVGFASIPEDATATASPPGAPNAGPPPPAPLPAPALSVYSNSRQSRLVHETRDLSKHE